MSFLFKALAQVLSLFYSFVPSYGFAILALTLVVMIAVTPLTLKGTRSMLMMQSLQPEIKKLQAQYKDDRQKLNEELLKFYRENNVNPVGGCLPMFVQMPVFIILYQVLRGLTRRVADVGYDTGWVAQAIQSGKTPTKTPEVSRLFDPAFLDHSSKLFQSLSQKTQMKSAGIDLAETASHAMGRGFLAALPFIILIIIVGVSGFIQQRQIQGRNPNQQINPQQQMIMKIMPIFLPLFSFTLPGGLVLYFAISNIYRVGQQSIITRSVYGMKKGEVVPTQRTAATGKNTSGAKVISTSAREKTKGSVSKTAQKTPAKSTFRDRALAAKQEAQRAQQKKNPKKQNSPAVKEQPVLQPRARKPKKR